MWYSYIRLGDDEDICNVDDTFVDDNGACFFLLRLEVWDDNSFEAAVVVLVGFRFVVLLVDRNFFKPNPKPQRDKLNVGRTIIAPLVAALVGSSFSLDIFD